MGRIFLSYAREDVEAAQAFAHALEGAGHEVWWDHHLRAGSRFSWDIAEALKNAEAVVVLWSRDSVESAWVQDEAAEGLESARLVPLTLDGSKPPLGFRQFHTIGMNGWQSGGEAFEPLLKAVAAAISGDRSTAPAPVEREPVTRLPAIYVRPFVNKSGDQEQDYLSDGITEEIVTDLSKISALCVIGQTASMQADLKQLGITHVVEGTVRKAASRLRITAQLIETTSGRSVWAERYDRGFSDVFAIQDEISHAIVEALQLTLLPAEKSAIAEGRSISAEAYDLYLKARGLWPQAACGDYRKGQEVVHFCSEATAIDPDYANAWALTALASADLRFWQDAGINAISPAERAIRLDPHLPGPLCVRALHLEEQGKDQEAQETIEAALRLDPASWEAQRTAAQLLFRKRAFARAIPHLEKAARFPDHSSASMLIVCCRATKDAAGFRRAAQLAVKVAELVAISEPANGSAFASAARGFAALGEKDRTRKWIRKALAVDPGNLAMRYSLAATAAAFLDDDDGALEILEPFAESVRFVPHLKLLERDPSWDAVRESASFEAMLQRARKRVEALSPVS